MNKQESYLRRIREAYPAREIRTARLRTSDGQFNDILILNDELIFRFPRSHHGAETMAREIAILRKIRGFITLAIPNPLYIGQSTEAVDESFMGYPLIPGEPLWRETLRAITDDTTLNSMAWQIATFLKQLHTVPVETLGLNLPISDGRTEWQKLYQDFRDRLFPYMRSDAREEVTHNFETFLDEPRHFAYTSVLRHGDCGGSNILYDPQIGGITGVIDFSSAGVGDPALDAAAVSTYGEDFLLRIRNTYPGIGAMQERIRFYKSTYALQEAFYGLRDGDQGAFENGIAAYIE